MDVMLDLETLGVKPTAVILTLGAVKFNPFDLQEPSDAIYFRIDVDSQLDLGREIDQGTLDWWGKQSPEVFAEAMDEEDRVSLEEAANNINRFIVGVDKIWANGTTFDIGILENLYRQLQKPIPWNYWQIRDARTIYDLGDDSAKKNNSIAHNALSDSMCQAKAIQQIYKELGVKKK